VSGEPEWNRSNSPGLHALAGGRWANRADLGGPRTCTAGRRLPRPSDSGILYRFPGLERSDHYDRHFFNATHATRVVLRRRRSSRVPQPGVMTRPSPSCHEGTQTNLRMSRRAPWTRLTCASGRSSPRCPRPEGAAATRVAENGSGLSCDLTFVARGPIIDQGRLFQRFATGLR